jgi:microcystin synthetase protein McyA
MKRENIEAICRLSPLQEGLLFHSLYAPGAGTYVNQHLIEFQGELDFDAFQSSWRHLIERHQALRASFHWQESDRPLQVIAKKATLSVERIDLRSLSSGARQRHIEEYLRADKERDFRLSDAPLMRLTLIRLTEDTYQLYWCNHHLILDGWSASILAQELLAIYAALSNGRPPALPPAPSFRNYIAWLQKQDLDSAEKFWRDIIGDFSEPRSLSAPLTASPKTTDFPESERYARFEHRLTETATRSLDRFARQNGITLGTMVHGAWAVLLSRYLDSSDVVFGVTSSGRATDIPRIDAMVGLLINTLPVRVAVDPQASVIELLRAVQDYNLRVREFEYSPLSQVQGWSGAPPGSALFDTLLVFENYPVDETVRQGSGGLRIRQINIMEITNYPLALTVGPGVSISIQALYDRARFEAEAVTQILGHFARLLQEMAVRADRAVGDLRMLTEDEERLLIGAPPLIVKDMAPKHCLHEMFEAQAAKTPGAPAVRFEGRELTYAELNHHANRLARRLRRFGVKPDTRVAILMEPSLDMIVALLGVLKAGGAYVPLDPAYPAERLSFLMRDSQALMVMTLEAWRGKAPETAERILTIDGDLYTYQEESPENLPTTATPENLAYIIYTSGSTGQPKGALITHENVVRLFTQTHPWFRFGPHDVWTMFHSFSFDFSVWEIFGALLYGGKLVVTPPATARAPESFYRLLAQEKVTVLNQTPSAFRQLLAYLTNSAGHPIEELSLRLVIFGGEALEIGTLARWFELYGDHRPQLVNMYGITETTVHVTYRPLSYRDLGSASVIGIPIPDIQTYIVDRQQRPVPPGVVGELLVGGAGTARGYLNRPGLTASRFQPDPFSRRPGARLYRSGDLARRLASGELVFIGRADAQVKIRGFRIELGEIETALAAHPAVRDCAVTARADGNGEKRLTAYLVYGNGINPKVGELREFLLERLPEHMVPASFVNLDRLPLTAHGKLDHRALPEPDSFRPALEETYVAPRTEIERQLAEVWGEVLGIEQVGIHDNYFNLGGDSIRSIRIRARALERGLDFSLQQLFESRTINSLAPHVRISTKASPERRARKPFDLLAPADREKIPTGVADAYPLTMLQAGLLFHSAYNGDGAVYLDLTSLLIRAPFDETQMRRALSEVIARHPILRTSFDLTGYSVPVQLVNLEATLPLSVADLRGKEEGEQERIISDWYAAEQSRPIDWKQAPLIYFQIHRRHDDEFQFSLRFHHAILDGWSEASMLAELFKSYAALLDGGALPEFRPGIPFSEFVALERESLSSSACREYWRQKLDGSASTLLLDANGSGMTESRRGASKEVILSPTLSERLKWTAQELGLPLKAVLLAAHIRAVGFCTGRAEIITGLVVNGRPEQEDGDRTLGLFLNTLPLRARISIGGAWADLIRAVFARESEMAPYRRYPQAQMQRDRHGEVLFDTAFNYVNFHIYESLPDKGSIQVVEARFFADTNFALLADFGLARETEQIRMTLNYNAAGISEEQIERITGYYIRALEAIADDADACCDGASSLETDERRLSICFGQTSEDYHGNLCLHQLIEAQAARTPGRIAIIFDQDQLRYDQLNQRANSLARSLRRLGAGPEVLVGVAMSRSLRMAVALLGILKSGAAYLPLDPGYPPERLAFMLQDSRPLLVLTERHLVSSLPAFGGQVLCLDQDLLISHGQIEEAESDPAWGADPESLAYVIYTSGSTGKPKGVAITHRSATIFLHWAAGAFSEKQMTCVAATTSICFDLSVFELFATLSRGGTILLLESALDLGHYRHAEKITLLNTVPSVMNELARAGAVPPSVSTINLAGEALSEELVERLYKETRVEQVLNLYGPTEDTTYSTFARIDRDKHGRPTIGRPITNTQVYLLNPLLEPVPVGAPGEIYLGGDGLARSYLNRAALTAEKFIPDPFSRRTGGRLYRTGDLARYGSDGELEFLGRSDYQIKIRGFRVELGEIEAALNTHPAVAESVVTARESAGIDRRLIAFIIPRGTNPSAEELRAYLGDKLPDYMLPAAYVIVPDLPRTVNGKLDRRALPAGLEITEPRTRPLIMPRDSRERTLLRVWQEVLGSEDISVDDNFFSIGGDSLLSIRLCAKTIEAGLQVTLRLLYEHPTIAGLAAVCGSSQIIDIEQDRETGPIPLAPAQLYFFGFEHSNPNHYNLSGLLCVRAGLKPEQWRRLAQGLAERHDSLRLRFTQLESGWTATIAPHDPDSLFHYVDLSTAEPSRWRHLIEESATHLQSTLNIKDGPLFRLIYFDTGEERSSRLMYLIHHLVADGQSLWTLLEDLEAGITKLIKGEELSFPVRSSSWGQWVKAINTLACSGALLTDLDYWLRTCEEPPCPIPRDLAGSHNINATASELRLLLSQEETRAFFDRAQAVPQGELQVLLATALARALSLWTGADRVSFDWIGHGRESLAQDLDVSRTVGYFTDRVPLTFRINERETFEQSRDGVRAQLQGIPNRGTTWGILRYLSPDLSVRQQLQKIPRPEVSLNYLGNVDRLQGRADLIELVEEPCGPLRDPFQERACLIQLYAATRHGRLEVLWRYSETYHRRRTIQSLADNFSRELKSCLLKINA